MALYRHTINATDTSSIIPEHFLRELHALAVHLANKAVGTEVEVGHVAREHHARVKLALPLRKFAVERLLDGLEVQVVVQALQCGLHYVVYVVQSRLHFLLLGLGDGHEGVLALQLEVLQHLLLVVLVADGLLVQLLDEVQLLALLGVALLVVVGH